MPYPFPTLCYKFHDLIRAVLIEVGKDFGQAPKAGKAGIFSTGPLRQNSFFKNENAGFGKAVPEMQGTTETYNTATHDSKIGIREPGVIFPVTQLHAASDDIFGRYGGSLVFPRRVHFKPFHKFGGIIACQVIRVVH